MTDRKIIDATAGAGAAIPAHTNIFSALAAAQMEMTPVKKTSRNPAFKSSDKPEGSAYADLADVVSACLPALNKHGIALVQYTKRDEFARYMTTALVHGASDTRVECDVELIVGKNDMQGFKSATTYAKRIGLESVTGLAPQDDDDGNEAVRQETISAEQFRTLKTLLDEAHTDEKKLAAIYAIEDLHDLPARLFDPARALLQQRKAKASG